MHFCKNKLTKKCAVKQKKTATTDNNKKTRTLITIKQYRESFSLMKDPVLCGLYVSHLIPIVANDLNYIPPTELRLGCSLHAQKIWG